MSPKPRIETNDKGQFVLDLPFDDGGWMKIVLGTELPNFPEWLTDGNERKATTARFYISALEGCPPSRNELNAYRAKHRERAMEEARAFADDEREKSLKKGR
jgi:hypothetical protein